MRIHLASIVQESNSFCPRATNLDCFRRGSYRVGQEVASAFRDTNTELGGFLSTLDGRTNIELRCGLGAWAVAGGPVTRRTLNHLKERLLDELARDLPVQGVLIALHGALIAEDTTDADGEIA